MFFKNFQIIIRSYSSNKWKKQPISPLLRYHMDTKSVFGPQAHVPKERSKQANDFLPPTEKNLFDRETELLYGEQPMHRACHVPKGVPISEQQQYIRHLFRIPRGQLISHYPQAYVANKDLGKRNKEKK